jgi:D-aminoacyl-tRNA deacylase
MRFAIAYSKLDKAGVNIVEQLKKISFLPQIPIIELKKETIYSDDLSENKFPELRNVDFLVFASRHASKEERKTFSLHAPGNWRNADFGGKSGKICNTSAFILKYLFQQLNKNAQEQNLEGYEVTLEATHHGPLIEIPCCFIELGSSELQWKDEKAAQVVAKAILSLQDYKIQPSWIPCIGIGGPHYCSNFNKIQLNNQYAISHIIPEYALPLTETMLKQAEQKTTEQIKQVILDWKGCGKSEERQKTINLLNQLGLSYKRTKNLEKGTEQ